MEVEKTIREYIANVIHMSLATSKDNKPWVCEVHFAYDEELNLYFRSLLTRRHSIEIASNPFVAGNIIEQHGQGQKPRGVYFEGKAELLDNVDVNHPAYKATSERFNFGEEIIEKANSEDGTKFYKISVENFYLFDVRESTPAQKYELPWRK
jgi:uncharacterized protein YhbP (UPF0306 family)